MARYIGKRLLWMIPIIVGIVVLIFTLLPLILYNNNTLVINEDIQLQDEAQKGGEPNAKES